VYEVDPSRGGNPRPITALGRFEHEAVSFDRRAGAAYLTEDADTSFGYFYRFRPRRRCQRTGHLHAGGTLQALRIRDLDGTDLSAITEAGIVFRRLEWVPIEVTDPAAGRRCGICTRRHPIPKCEGIWWGDGIIWFVSSHGGGPDAEDEEDRTRPSMADRSGRTTRAWDIAPGRALRAVRRLRGPRQHHRVTARLRGHVH